MQQFFGKEAVWSQISALVLLSFQTAVATALIGHASDKYVKPDGAMSPAYFELLEKNTHIIYPALAILVLHQLAEPEQIDLVALSAQGYSGNHQWPYGSMVNHFILYGRAPLLIIQDLPFKQEPISPELSTFKRIEY